MVRVNLNPHNIENAIDSLRDIADQKIPKMFVQILLRWQIKRNGLRSSEENNCRKITMNGIWIN